jgi:anthranilate phosphoribosyltransferase
MSFDAHGGWPAMLGRLTAGDDLTRDQSYASLSEVLEGRATPAQVAAFIVALRMKGETVDEMGGLVDAMLDACRPLDLPDSAIDIVSTGGSAARRAGALNVSTMAAFVAAGAGAVVCKHGNRKASSTSGSFDLLEALGITVDLDGPAVSACVEQAGLGFAFARHFHPAMRHAAPVRAELGVPTVFNFLGPLSHPGRVTRQVIGVSDAAMIDKVVGVLIDRRAPHAMVVHGDDGLDELTTTAPTTVHEIRDGETDVRQVDSTDWGLARVGPDQLRGGDADANARLAAELFAGTPGPVRDIVVLNAAAGLIVAGQADDFSDGIAAAAAALDDGRARASLDRLVAVSAAVAVD